MQELEQELKRLLETAWKVQPGPVRNQIFRELEQFRLRINALQERERSYRNARTHRLEGKRGGKDVGEILVGCLVSWSGCGARQRHRRQYTRSRGLRQQSNNIRGRLPGGVASDRDVHCV